MLVAVVVGGGCLRCLLLVVVHRWSLLVLWVVLLHCCRRCPLVVAVCSVVRVCSRWLSVGLSVVVCDGLRSVLSGRLVWLSEVVGCGGWQCSGVVAFAGLVVV